MAQTDRRNAAARGYGHKWRKESTAFLAANPWCVLKGEGCTLISEVTDHTIPHRGDVELFWRRSNWQPLCKHCHDTHKQRIEAQGPLRDHRGRLIQA
jgi:5-methylcytosine-specific restriction enzyme A